MIRRITSLFTEFIKSEQASGVILIFCTLASLLIANSTLGDAYLHLWHHAVGPVLGPVNLHFSIEFWINDGLMAIFFLLVGLEIKRELMIGKLSSPRHASLPFLAALGGMVTPAAFHFLFNHGSPTQSGMGIPMATDIAFAIGVMGLLGSRVPLALKVFLTALAIIDDLGAIIVIALFYGSDLSYAYLGAAFAIFALLIILGKLGLRSLFFFLIPGAVMWYCMLQSGIHATIAGVMLAFAIPFEKGGDDTPASRLQHVLHKPVGYFIMPVFALTNTAIVLGSISMDALLSINSTGIFAGLVLGKPIGITLFSLVAVKLGLSAIPQDTSWRQVFGAGCLGGIGFTMSIFITLLAFDDMVIIQASKLAILVSSLTAGVIGFIILKTAPSKASPAAS